MAVLVCVGCARSEKPPAPEALASSPASVAYTIAAKEIQVEYRPVSIPTQMAAGSRAEVRFEARNAGSKTWPAAGEFPFVFGYHWEEIGQDGAALMAQWDDGNRATLPGDVKPGESVPITLPVNALPKRCPNCRLVIVPLLELKAWSESAKFIAPMNIS